MAHQSGLTLFPRIQSLLKSPMAQILYHKANESLQIRRIWNENIEFFQRTQISSIDDNPQIYQSLKQAEIQVISLAQEFLNVKPTMYKFTQDQFNDFIEPIHDYYNDKKYHKTQEERIQNFHCDIDYFKMCQDEERMPKPDDHQGPYGYERIIEKENLAAEKLKQCLEAETDYKQRLDRQHERELLTDSGFIKQQKEFEAHFKQQSYDDSKSAIKHAVLQEAGENKGQQPALLEKQKNLFNRIVNEKKKKNLSSDNNHTVELLQQKISLQQKLKLKNVLKQNPQSNQDVIRKTKQSITLEQNDNEFNQIPIEDKQ